MSLTGIEKAEAAVVAQLTKIRVENGYRSDVEKVYRVPLNADQIPDGNNLVVVPQPDGSTFEPHDGHYRMTDRLVIGGVHSMGQAELFDPERVTRLNHLLEDAIDALLEDPAFGFRPNLDSVLEVGDRGVDSDRGFGYFSIRLHLTYHFARRTM